jgi:hypothetical protein
MHTPIIASILSQLGFVTRITSSGVIVSLSRPVSTLEVEYALTQEFEGIQFQVSRIGQNSILVQE